MAGAEAEGGNRDDRGIVAVLRKQTARFFHDLERLTQGYSAALAMTAAALRRMTIGSPWRGRSEIIGSASIRDAGDNSNV